MMKNRFSPGFRLRTSDFRGGKLAPGDEDDAGRLPVHEEAARLGHRLDRVAPRGVMEPERDDQAVAGLADDVRARLPRDLRERGMDIAHFGVEADARVADGAGVRGR